MNTAQKIYNYLEESHWIEHSDRYFCFQLNSDYGFWISGSLDLVRHKIQTIFKSITGWKFEKSKPDGLAEYSESMMRKINEELENNFIDFVSRKKRGS